MGQRSASSSAKKLVEGVGANFGLRPFSRPSRARTQNRGRPAAEARSRGALRPRPQAQRDDKRTTALGKMKHPAGARTPGRPEEVATTSRALSARDRARARTNDKAAGPASPTTRQNRQRGTHVWMRPAPARSARRKRPNGLSRTKAVVMPASRARLSQAAPGQNRPCGSWAEEFRGRPLSHTAIRCDPSRPPIGRARPCST